MSNGSNQEAVERVVRMASERGEFAELEDGYVHYFPGKGGALAAWELRALADELDRRNATWDAVVSGALPPECLQVWKFEDAPEEFRALSTSGGDEDWLALVPPGMADGSRELWWMHWYPNDQSRGNLQVAKHPKFPDLEIWIGSHA